ncbi:hypothetical protein V6N13_001494 [Hibiscus sabdariffa]
MASFTNDPTTFIPNAMDPMGTAPIIEDHINAMRVLNLIPLMVIKPHVKTTVDPTKDKGVALMNIVTSALETDIATRKSPNSPRNQETKINIDNEDVYVNVEDSNNNSLDMASFTNDPTTFIPNAMDPMGTAPIIEDHINAMRVLNLIPLMVIKPHVKTAVDPTKDKGVALMNIVTSALETDMATRKSPNSPRNQEVFTHGGTFQDQKDLPLPPASNNKVGMSSDKNSPAQVDVQPR